MGASECGIACELAEAELSWDSVAERGRDRGIAVESAFDCRRHPLLVPAITGLPGGSDLVGRSTMERAKNGRSSQSGHPGRGMQFRSSDGLPLSKCARSRMGTPGPEVREGTPRHGLHPRDTARVAHDADQEVAALVCDLTVPCPQWVGTVEDAPLGCIWLTSPVSESMTRLGGDDQSMLPHLGPYAVILHRNEDRSLGPLTPRQVAGTSSPDHRVEQNLW